MGKTVEDYLNLVTSEHRNKPNFIATITAVVSVLVQIQSLLASMIDLFDLDLAPTGDQLDIIGEWVGASRDIPEPITGAIFTWDDQATDGWDAGIWASSTGQTQIISLPDDVYLTLILAKIAANNWDGTIEGAYEIWAQVLPQYNVLIQDNQDMSYYVVIQGSVPDALTAALFLQGLLFVRPAGIEQIPVVPVDTNPIFAWDWDTDNFQGWDDASWGTIGSPS